ncbi:MAG TPA: hypothetical protein VHD33_02835, partial [Legionellaceae bacterium]|nr:hypothetical protein [Legionellaceae bacterium]
MTQRFTFPISGAFANCCIGNVNYLLNVENQPTFFTFKDINLSTDFQNLMIEVEDDTCSEKEIHQYLEKSLAGSNYKLCNEHARKYWLRGFVGLGIGALTLLLSCFACHFLWIKIAIAFFSIPVTCFLGIESFRDAKVEMHRKVLSMDILFLLSTFSAILISCMALFIPAFPMMFEAGLLMFGFRHIGTAIKMSVYETAAAPVQYERLVRNTLFKRLQQDKEELVPMGQLLPGDIIVLEKDALVPLDGWLWAEAHETILMDVSRKEGTFTPKKCVNNTPITAGMSSQIRTKMQIGFGHTLKFFTCQPSQNCPAGEIWIYPKHNTIHIHTYSDRDGKPIEFFLDDASLIDGHGKDFKPDIIDQLLSPTNALQHQHTRIHLADAAYQQLSRAIVRHAKKYGLTQTRSYLREISKELEKPMVQSKQRTESAHFFVQVVMAIALISGIIVGCLYAPLMGVRCMMAILVSVCPCAYGSIEPLVMYYARKRAEELHIILSHSDALSGLAKVDVIALDYHGTVTQGKPQIEIHYTEGGDQKDIDTKLAFIEHGSQHYIGKAIYEKIKGNQLLSHGDFPKLTLTEYHGGMEAVIGDQTYIVGNQHCLQRFGVTPKVV